MPSKRASASYAAIFCASATALASPDASPEDKKYRIAAHGLFQDAALRRRFEERDDVAAPLCLDFFLHPRNGLGHVELGIVQ